MNEGLHILPQGNNPDISTCNYLKVFKQGEASAAMFEGEIVTFSQDKKDKFDYVLAQYNSYIYKDYFDKLAEVPSKYRVSEDEYKSAHGIFASVQELGKSLLRLYIPRAFKSIYLYTKTTDGLNLKFIIEAENSLRDREYIISVYLNSDPGVDDMSIQVHTDNKDPGQIVEDPHANQIIPIGNINRDHIGHELYSRNEFLNEGIVNGQNLRDSYRRLVFLGNYTEPRHLPDTSGSFVYTEPTVTNNTITVSTANELYSALEYIRRRTSTEFYTINQTADIVLNDLSTVESITDISIPSGRNWLQLGSEQCINLTYNGNNHRIFGFLSNTSALFPNLDSLTINDLILDTGYYLLNSQNYSHAAVIDSTELLVLNNVENHISLIKSPGLAVDDSRTYASFAGSATSLTIYDTTNYGSVFGFDDSDALYMLSAFIGEVPQGSGSVTFNRCVNYGSITPLGNSYPYEGAGFLNSFNGTTYSNLQFYSCVNYGSINCKLSTGFCAHSRYAYTVILNRLVNNGYLGYHSENESAYNPIVADSIASLQCAKIYNNVGLTASYDSMSFERTVPRNKLNATSDSNALDLPTKAGSLVYKLNDNEDDKCWKQIEIGTFPVPYKVSNIHSI